MPKIYLAKFQVASLDNLSAHSLDKEEEKVKVIVGLLGSLLSPIMEITVDFSPVFLKRSDYSHAALL